MRKLVLGLAVSTLAFAGSTLYFWRELAAERSRHARPVELATLPVPAPAPVPASAAPAIPVPASTEPAPRRDRLTKEQRMAQAYIDARKQMAETAPALLASLTNAQSRADMVAEQKATMRTYSPGLQRYLGLSDDAYDRFLDALAELDLTGREAAARCALDANCRFPNWDRSIIEARRRDALSQFGAEVAEKYDFYRRSGNERQVVAEFRGRLDDTTRLTDAQSEKLIHALVEEHERIRAGLEKRPGNIGTINGVAYAEMAVGAPEEPTTDRTEEINEYNRQLRDSAASVLNAAQLAAFEQMQAEAIDESRSMQRRRRDQTAGTSN